MKVREIMTSNIKVIPPECTLTEAAQMMRDMDIGAIPICDSERILGMVTDRDIVIKAIAQNMEPRETQARTIMSSPIIYCFDDDDVEDVARVMEVRQIRRVVVVNRQKRLAGILALGDLAAKTGNEPLAGEALEKISEPSQTGRAA